ncbi:MAG: cupin domain-containing protein [Actinobacteria bacterium]|jgi:predicted cupin superfamily sugar epimerase|nr:cupin domain-containing protein [Actinomycetota bacterium]
MTTEEPDTEGQKRGRHGRLTAPSTSEVVESLLLEPHPEGGFFRETYRSTRRVHTEAGERPLSTVILYLVTDEDPSRFHRLRFEEMWFYHAGAPLEVVLLGHAAVSSDAPGEPSPPAPAGGSRLLGPDLPQTLVPAGCWVGARVIRGEQADWGGGRAPERRWTPDRRATHDYRWTLVGCVVSPGFDYDDFEPAGREALLREFPQARQVILSLT